MVDQGAGSASPSVNLILSSPLRIPWRLNRVSFVLTEIKSLLIFIYSLSSLLFSSAFLRLYPSYNDINEKDKHVYSAERTAALLFSAAMTCIWLDQQQYMHKLPVWISVWLSSHQVSAVWSRSWYCFVSAKNANITETLIQRPRNIHFAFSDFKINMSGLESSMSGNKTQISKFIESWMGHKVSKLNERVSCDPWTSFFYGIRSQKLRKWCVQKVNSF